MVLRGLSERRALTVVRMSASALRYAPRRDQDADLRDRIVALAHRHRRYGAGMIYLKLRQEGRVVNHKRVDRLTTVHTSVYRPGSTRKVRISNCVGHTRVGVSRSTVKRWRRQVQQSPSV
jgi:hypothetical protein